MATIEKKTIFDLFETGCKLYSYNSLNDVPDQFVDFLKRLSCLQGAQEFDGLTRSQQLDSNN